MKRSWGVFSIWLVLLVCARPVLGETFMGDNRILNARQWGDHQNRSYLPVSGRLTGLEVWKQPTIRTESPLPAVHMSCIDSFLAVSYGIQMDLRRLGSGQLIWSESTLLNCSFEATADGFVNVDHVGYLRMLGLDGKQGDRVELPLVAGNGRLHLVRRLDREIQYSYELPPGQVSQPGDKITHPEYAFARTEVSSGEIAWLLERTGLMVTTLLSLDGARGAVAGADRLFLFDLPPLPDPLPDEELDIPVKEIVFDQLLAASYDHDGNLLVVERLRETEERPEEVFLRRLSPEGEPQWQFSLGRPTDLSQPPASYPDGDVCMTIGSEIWRIRNGHLVWSVPMPAEPGKILLTLLADGTLLAAAGPLLVQLSAEGEELARVVVDDPITCRPIMDHDGNTYVAGIQGVRCLR